MQNARDRLTASKVGSDISVCILKPNGNNLSFAWVLATIGKLCDTMLFVRRQCSLRFQGFRAFQDTQSLSTKRALTLNEWVELSLKS